MSLEEEITNKGREHLSGDIQEIIDYIDIGGNDLQVIKSELGELILRINGEYGIDNEAS